MHDSLVVHWCSSLLDLFWCFFVCVFNCTRPNRGNILYTLLQTKWAKSIRYFRQQMLNVISDKKRLEMIPYCIWFICGPGPGYYEKVLYFLALFKTGPSITIFKTIPAHNFAIYSTTGHTKSAKIMWRGRKRVDDFRGQPWQHKNGPYIGNKWDYHLLSPPPPPPPPPLPSHGIYGSVEGTGVMLQITHRTLL